VTQSSDALIALIQAVNGVSDVDAAADFEVVGNQTRRERWRIMPEEVKIGIDAVQQAIFNQRVAARIEEATKWAIWNDGEQFIGVQRHPLKKYIEEIIASEVRLRYKEEVK